MAQGFNLPVIMDVPIEKESELNERVTKDVSYISEKQKKIAKEYNSPKGTNIRRVAEYLWQHHQENLSYEDIARELNLPLSSVKLYVANLNFYEGFPMTWIPVPKRKGFIQGSLNNQTDYENWDIKKQRTITSMEQVKDKAEAIFSGKQRQKKKVKVVIKNKEIENA